MNSKQKNLTFNLVFVSLMIALEVVLSRIFSISLWNIKLGFAFIPVLLVAIRLGPLAAAVCAGFADLLGAIVLPIGPYFPGFTFSAALSGFIMGLFLYKKRGTKSILYAVVSRHIICSLFFNTLFINVLYGSPIVSLLLVRIPGTIMMAFVEMVTISFIDRYARNNLEKKIF